MLLQWGGSIHRARTNGWETDVVMVTVTAMVTVQCRAGLVQCLSQGYMFSDTCLDGRHQIDYPDLKRTVMVSVERDDRGSTVGSTGYVIQ